MAMYTQGQVESILSKSNNQLDETTLVNDKVLYSSGGKVASGTIDYPSVEGLLNGSTKQSVYSDNIKIWNGSYSHYLVIDSMDSAMDNDVKLNIKLGNSDRNISILGDVVLDQSIAKESDVEFNDIVANGIIKGGASDTLHLGDISNPNSEVLVEATEVNIAGENVSINSTSGDVFIGKLDKSNKVYISGDVKTIGKLGFYGTAPIEQPTTIGDATDPTSTMNNLNNLINKLKALGLIAS